MNEPVSPDALTSVDQTLKACGEQVKSLQGQVAELQKCVDLMEARAPNLDSQLTALTRTARELHGLFRNTQHGKLAGFATVFTTLAAGILMLACFVFLVVGFAILREAGKASPSPLSTAILAAAVLIALAVTVWGFVRVADRDR